MKNTILPFLSGQHSSAKYIYIIVQQTSRTFPSSETHSAPIK